MKNASCNIWNKRTAQLIVVFAILLVLFGLGCSGVNPKVQDEYVRDNLSEDFMAVSRLAFENWIKLEQI